MLQITYHLFAIYSFQTIKFDTRVPLSVLSANTHQARTHYASVIVLPLVGLVPTTSVFLLQVMSFRFTQSL